MSHVALHRVRYAETDQMGVVYYANHFVWFEIGRAELLRAAGIPYAEFERRGIFTPVVEAYCKYKSPARYDELIEIHTSVTTVKGTRFRFEYAIREHETGRLIAEGYTVLAFTDRSGRPIAIEQLHPDIHGMLKRMCEKGVDRSDGV
ncbi:MAG: acyl-CoA thioesterase [Bacillota bacterium]